MRENNDAKVPSIGGAKDPIEQVEEEEEEEEEKSTAFLFSPL